MRDLVCFVDYCATVAELRRASNKEYDISSNQLALTN